MMSFIYFRPSSFFVFLSLHGSKQIYFGDRRQIFCERPRQKAECLSKMFEEAKATQRGHRGVALMLVDGCQIDTA